MGHHETLMEKYIYSTICSCVLADVAITVWRLEADKSGAAVEVGLKPNWLEP